MLNHTYGTSISDGMGGKIKEYFLLSYWRHKGERIIGLGEALPMNITSGKRAVKQINTDTVHPVS